LTGFAEGERAVIANIARYHRGSPPKDRHPDFAALNTADRDSVARLGAILRLADGLDRSHESRVRELECVVEGEVITITLQSEVDCEKEITEAERRRPLFEQAFNCKLSINARRAKSTRA
jgi:exopolyphosphatase/guanosine-5'-triphosphate,3'-diphosphate pyrophosphatase